MERTLSWIKENIKTAIAIISFVSMAMGFIAGVYVTHQKLGNDIELLSDKIDLIKQWIHTAR